MRLLFIRQFLAKLRPLHKKLDFQISRYISMAGKDIEEINFNNQKDELLMRPNLAFEDLAEDQGILDDDDQEDLMNTPKMKALVQRRVDRAMENGYAKMDKSQKQDLMRAIREKREKGSKEDKRIQQFNEFRKKRLLQSSAVRDLENEMDQRPEETEKRPNLKGIYDPMQEKRDKMDENYLERTNLTKDQKKVINKRVGRIKQQEKIDDFTEMEKIGEILDLQSGTEKNFKFKKSSKLDKSGKEELKKKKRGNWAENKDEERYDSKRQARISRASKIRGKKGKR